MLFAAGSNILANLSTEPLDPFALTKCTVQTPMFPVSKLQKLKALRSDGAAGPDRSEVYLHAHGN